MKLGIVIEETWDFLNEIYADLRKHHQVSLFHRREVRLPFFYTRINRYLLHRDLLRFTRNQEGSYFVEAWFLNEDDSAILTNGGRSEWFSMLGSSFSSVSDSGVFEPRVQWENRINTSTPLESR
jgi:hypothetical protein